MTAPAEPLHLLKLCVGADTVEDLSVWQAQRRSDRSAAGLDPRPRHTTRMWPRRASELLAGGSLYWVIRGVLCARQTIADLQPVVGADGIRRCDIVLEHEIVPVAPRPRRAFQGWRYLTAADAPMDLSALAAAPGSHRDLPPELAASLAEYGVVQA